MKEACVNIQVQIKEISNNTIANTLFAEMTVHNYLNGECQVVQTFLIKVRFNN